MDEIIESGGAEDFLAGAIKRDSTSAGGEGAGVGPVTGQSNIIGSDCGI